MLLEQVSNCFRPKFTDFSQRFSTISIFKVTTTAISEKEYHCPFFRKSSGYSEIQEIHKYKLKGYAEYLTLLKHG